MFGLAYTRSNVCHDETCTIRSNRYSKTYTRTRTLSPPPLRPHSSVSQRATSKSACFLREPKGHIQLRLADEVMCLVSVLVLTSACAARRACSAANCARRCASRYSMLALSAAAHQQTIQSNRTREQGMSERTRAEVARSIGRTVAQLTDCRRLLLSRCEVVSHDLQPRQFLGAVLEIISLRLHKIERGARLLQQDHLAAGTRCSAKSFSG